MAGNVWEWCSDWYRPDAYALAVKDATGGVVRNPRGPARSASFDPMEPGQSKRLQHGGSFLCSDQYCTRYMTGTKGSRAGVGEDGQSPRAIPAGFAPVPGNGPSRRGAGRAPGWAG